MYKVGIIGLGSIAARYSKPSDPYPYCHTGGIRFCDATQLVAVADLSEERRNEFRQTWGPAFPEGSITYYDSDSEMLEKEQLDIVAVCVRGPYHYEVTMRVIEAGTKVIFLEKPAGCSLNEVDEMTEASDKKGIAIVVDYSRHWAPHLIKIQELIEDGIIGEIQSVIGYCGGGTLSFAIHTTDLICQFAGYDPESVSAVIRQGSGNVPDGYEPEPSTSGAVIQFSSGVIGYQVGKHGTAPAFAADVLGSEGIIRAGMYIGAMVRRKSGEIVDNASLGMPENASVFKVAYDQIAAYLDGGPLPHCAREDYMAVNEIGFAMIESGITGQRVDIPCQKRDRFIFANG
jgi:predicted dehydrogenase